MIENIYSTETFSPNLTNKNIALNSRIKSPKNVRQIGKIGNNLKIYVEDYVKTYTRQLAEDDLMERCIAILIGEYRVLEGEKDLFIYGAIGTGKAYAGGKIEFTEEVWTSIYEIIKQYFPEGEIVGWYFGGTSFGTEETKQLQMVHIDNFAGKDKVLLTYDFLDKEDNFYLYENGCMVLQPGYYIYYEKNEEMQNYMVDHKKVKHEEEMVDDHAIKEIRTKILEKKQSEIGGKEQRTVLHLAYAAGTLMIVVALLVVVTIVNNSEKMKSLETALTTITKSLTEKKERTDQAEKNNSEGNIFDIDESIPASTNQGNVTLIPDSENKNDDLGLPQTTSSPTENENENENTSDLSLVDEEGNTEDENGENTSEENTNVGNENKENTGNEDNSNENSTEDDKNSAGTENLTDENQSNEDQADEKQTEETQANETQEGGISENENQNEDVQETVEIDPTKLKVYTVKSGDTIAGICRKLYGSYDNMQLIKELNQLVDENIISIGQELLVP